MEDCYIRVSQIMENQRKGFSDSCVKVQKENLNIKAYLWGSVPNVKYIRFVHAVDSSGVVS